MGRFLFVVVVDDVGVATGGWSRFSAARTFEAVTSRKQVSNSGSGSKWYKSATSNICASESARIVLSRIRSLIPATVLSHWSRRIASDADAVPL